MTNSTLLRATPPVCHVWELGGTYPGIKMRGGPNELVRLVSSLTTGQCQDVSSIGMGGLLGLEVTEMPPQLGHWLVTNFKPAMMAIKLGNGRYINITAQDVAHVFGLPNGPLPITERDSPQVGPELRAWREETKQRKGKITVKALVTQALKLEGHLEDPPHATTDQAPPSEPPLSDQVALSQGIVHQPSTVDTPQGFTQLLDTTTRDLLCAAARVADMVRENCAQAYGDHNFKRVNEASKLLLEVLQHEPKGTYSTIDQEPHTPHQTSIDREDAFWQNPDNIKALERAELATIWATTGSDMPSFSLGFTQEYPNTGK
nr:uncharacterized protein LOC109150699 isoform X5 [Ipomoea batatas]